MIDYQVLADCLRELFLINVGLVKVKILPGNHINIIFESENGWLIQVFNDAEDWDYIERIKPPHKEWIELWATAGESFLDFEQKYNIGEEGCWHPISTIRYWNPGENYKSVWGWDY